MLQAIASPVFGLPRVPRTIVSRPRISQLIAGLLENHDLIVVRAPAGSGKTVALADWASSGITPGHISWVTLDELYADRTSFWREMILGTARRVDESLRPMIVECAEALTAGADPRTVLRRFVPYVPETILVIDRIDFITDEALLEDMAWVLQNSRSIRAVVTARARSILECKAMALVMDVATVGPDPFHLTAEETSALVTLRGLDLDAEELHAATGGHPLLTRATMAVHDPAGTLSMAATVENAVSEFLGISLAGSSLGPGVQDFMVRTSIPESFTVALASQMSGSGDPATILNDLEDQGLGMWSRFGKITRFRYGVAVRALLHRSLKNVDQREINRLTRMVINHDLEYGNAVNALRQAAAIGDLALTSLIARDHHMTLLVSQPGEVLQILESVTLPRLRQHPTLLMAMALCYNATAAGRFKALEFFSLAVTFAGVYRSSMDPAQRIWMLTLESTALRFSGKLEPALKQANLAVQSFEESPLHLRDALAGLEPTLFTQAAIAHIHDQQFDTAAKLLTKALDAGRRAQPLPSTFLGTGLLAFTLAQAGRVPEARTHLTWLNEARWPPGMLEGYWATTYRLAQVREAMDRQAYIEASGHLGKITEEMQASEFWPFIVSYQALLDLARTGPAAGPARLETTIRDGNKAPLNQSGAIELDCLRATIQLIAGNPLKACAALLKHTGSDPRVMIMRARIALHSGDPTKSLAFVGRVRKDLDPRLELQRLLLCAAALLRTGDVGGARDNAEMAASLMKAHKLSMTAVLIPPEDLTVLAGMVHAVEPGILQPIQFRTATVETTSLTPRERVVLDALATLASTAAVAESLGVAVNTVKSQRRSILKKLGVHTREEALRKARKQGLLGD